MSLSMCPGRGVSQQPACNAGRELTSHLPVLAGGTPEAPALLPLSWSQQDRPQRVPGCKSLHSSALGRISARVEDGTCWS